MIQTDYTQYSTSRPPENLTKDLKNLELLGEGIEITTTFHQLEAKRTILLGGPTFPLTRDSFSSTRLLASWSSLTLEHCLDLLEGGGRLETRNMVQVLFLGGVRGITRYRYQIPFRYATVGSKKPS